ncbi:WAS/WASL-interacting protein family member 3-like [Zingiber officinale]|uniref:WAS/WASL-interacting protein family member 3-like n=1 Tax=Zingiber officinale TaxID=94328 RepID=UPI001C4C001C|nr:WAS/WASL-interacting protein family member 3-like [Zingiber officinale]
MPALPLTPPLTLPPPPRTACSPSHVAAHAPAACRHPPLLPPAATSGMPARTACSPFHAAAHAPATRSRSRRSHPCCHLRPSCPLAPPAQLPPPAPAPPPQHCLAVDMRPPRSTTSARSDQRLIWEYFLLNLRNRQKPRQMEVF